MQRFFTKRTAVISTAVAATLVAGAAGGTAAALIAGGRGGPAATAEVVRTDLTMKAGGTLGYGGSYTVTIPSGAGAAQVAQAQQAVTQDQQVLAGDEQAESDETAAEQSAGHSATAQQTAKSNFDQAQEKVLSDQARLRGDQATLASLLAFATAPGTVYTWLPSPGQVIRQNQRVYALSAEPVPLLYGDTPAYRAFYAGMSAGPDVHQLNSDLAALGYGAHLAKSSDYTQATVMAVKGWQSAHGLPVTGQIPLGGVVFEPGPIRVTSVVPSVGQSVKDASGTVLTATGTTPVVTANLAAGQQNLVSPGDAVTVALPDGTSMSGHVKNVGDTTTTVTLDSAPAQAVPGTVPVSVTFGSRKADHVLAVPANALLTLPGDGYGVDEVTGGGNLRLVEVATGLRSNTLVEISGSGIMDGTTVAVPSSLGQQPAG